MAEDAISSVLLFAATSCYCVSAPPATEPFVLQGQGPARICLSGRDLLKNETLKARSSSSLTSKRPSDLNEYILQNIYNMETLNISDLPPPATSPTVPAPMTYEPLEEKVLNNSNDSSPFSTSTRDASMLPNAKPSTLPHTQSQMLTCRIYPGCSASARWTCGPTRSSRSTVNTSTREYSPGPIIERVDTPIMRLSTALRPHKEEAEKVGEGVVGIIC